MTNTDQTSQKSSSWIVITISLAVVAVVGWLYFSPQASKPVIKPQPEVEKPQAQLPAKANEPQVDVTPEVSDEIDESLVNEEETATNEIPAPVKNPLPALDNSDAYLQEKLTAMTWRKELLKLVIDDDMIRRFVVFVDNFAQGQLAYEHSPLVQPNTKFSAIEEKTTGNTQVWLWDEKSTRRFSLYVDLLRSFDSESLVNWYIELKPLIDQAYAELGYEDDDFTQTLQAAITRVLDMEIPKKPIELVRPSVMYKYKDPEIEALPDSDKLLLRLGKENLLVIKSVLLEISEKLARKSAEN